MIGASDERLCVGVITGAQGVRGAVRIKSFTADPRDVAAYGPVEDEEGGRRFDLRIVGAAKGVVIGKIAGIEDRDAAERLKGTRLYVARAALPEPEEDEYYHADLIGLPVELADGTAFGTLRAIHDFGAGDSLDIQLAAGGAIMVPFTRAVIPLVDLAGRRLVIDPPAGLFENRPVELESAELEMEALEEAGGAKPESSEG